MPNQGQNQGQERNQRVAGGQQRPDQQRQDEQRQRQDQQRQKQRQ